MNCESGEACLKSGTVYVVCNGCPENRLDVARAERYLIQNGWAVKPNMNDADLILFNACGLSNQTESHSIGIIKELKDKMKPNQRLIVWGCLPKIDLEGLKKQYQGQISCGSDLPELQQMFGLLQPIDQYFANHLGPVWPLSKENAPEYVRYKRSKFAQILEKPALRWDSYLNSRFNLVRRKGPPFFYIKISTGCQNNCAYCAVRISRGLTKSKPIENIVSEFKLGLQEGFKNFGLLGTDLGSYGIDLGYNLVDLLKELIKLDGDYGIFLRNFNPRHLKNMLGGFTEVLVTEKIKYTELAAESGSNHILKLMNRHYTIEEYRDLVHAVREAYPSLIIRTQLMAGFPTETDQDFQETLRLLDDVVFDYAEVYEFSERPGTLAMNMVPKVPDSVKRRRFLKLYRKAVLNRTPRKIKNILFNRM